MSKLTAILCILLTIHLTAAGQIKIYSTNNGEISFFSKAPLEDIEARNNMAISLINTSTNEIVVRVPIRQFQFRNKLMEEHFNENYMESERFTHATFKGTLNEPINFGQQGTYDVSASGVLNIHGVNQKRTLRGKLRIGPDNMVLETRFDVLLADHKIKIPKLVFNKIAERIAVSTSFTYLPYKK